MRKIDWEEGLRKHKKHYFAVINGNRWCAKCYALKYLSSQLSDLEREIEGMKDEYKNNEDYADYGTLDENICHDDGYMACADDILSLLDKKAEKK